MSKNSGRTILLITLGCFFAFFLFGFIDNLKGPTIGYVLQNLNFSYSQGGTIIFIGYIGYVISTLTSGIFADTIGKKAIILIATVSLYVGVTAYSLFSYFWFLSIAMLFIGFGLGSIDLGAHSIMVDIHREAKGKYLNLLTFFYGAGSMLGPFYAGQLLRVNFIWREVYQFSLILVGIVFIYFISIKYPKDNSLFKNSENSFKNLGKKAFTKEMCLYYLLVVSFIGVEVGIASWIVDFLQKVKLLSVSLSSLFLSLFFAAVMLGRLCGSFVVDRIGYIKSILCVSVIAAICISIGIFGPPVLVFFIPLSGLFLSIIFPTAVAAVSGVYPDNSGKILGLFFTFAGIGRMIGPWSIGIFSDMTGSKLGFGTILFYCMILVLSAGLLMKHEEQKKHEGIRQRFHI